MQKQSGSQSKEALPPWNILRLLNWTTTYFKERSIEGARASAEVLLAHALNLSRIDLYLRYDQPLHAEELALFKTLIKRRAAREPVAYIVGEKGFWSLDLTVTKDVLIPRPETECLVEEALSILSQDGSGRRILDMGTGSGAIALALASERPKDFFFASDRSIEALRVARKNAERHGLEERVSFFAGDWLSPVNPAHPFDLIVSNPPYIPKGDIPALQPEVSLFEPKSALDGGEDGLDDIRFILNHGEDYLVKDGWILLEIGCGQESGVARAAREAGAFHEALFRKDYAGLYRVAMIRKK